MEQEEVKLNGDQEKAMDAMINFLADPNRSHFFLTGAPGVGKTFTMRYFTQNWRRLLKEILGQKGLPLYFASNAVLKMTSTTNKAASVLSEQSRQSAQTIHSLLGVIPKDDYWSGKTILKKTDKWQIHKNLLVIIDEASMVQKALYRMLNQAFDSSCKVIFIGDKNQLSPVMEPLSPVCDLLDDPDTHYELTEIVRNAGSQGLIHLCHSLKEDIENEVDRENLFEWNEVPGQVEFINGQQFEQIIQDTFGPNGIQDPEDPELKARILCWRNARVLAYNRHVRSVKGLPSQFTSGEHLIAGAHIELSQSDTNVNVEQSVYLEEVNDELFQACHEFNGSMEYFGFKYYEAILWAGGNKAKVRIPENMDEYRNALKHYGKVALWPAYFHIKNRFADLRDREASTVHKSQGSTYDFVMIDHEDIMQCRNTDELRRLLYVAASRARHKIYVY